MASAYLQTEMFYSHARFNTEHLCYAHHDLSPDEFLNSTFMMEVLHALIHDSRNYQRFIQRLVTMRKENGACLPRSSSTKTCLSVCHYSSRIRTAYKRATETFSRESLLLQRRLQHLPFMCRTSFQYPAIYVLSSCMLYVLSRSCLRRSLAPVMWQ